MIYFGNSEIQEMIIRQHCMMIGALNVIGTLANRMGVNDDELMRMFNEGVDSSAEEMIGSFVEQTESHTENQSEGEKFMNKMFGIDYGEMANNLRVIANMAKMRDEEE